MGDEMLYRHPFAAGDDACAQMHGRAEAWLDHVAHLGTYPAQFVLARQLPGVS
jgi:hypothetical protein